MMNRLAVLALTTQLIACAGVIESDEGDLDNIEVFVPMNGLVSVIDNIELLAQGPLASGMLPASLNFDEGTRVFLQYLVECALEEKQEVKFGSDVYTGAFGICPSWNVTRPDRDCQEGVSACLIARNNKLGIKKRILMVGAKVENPPFDAYEPTVADNHEPEALGAPIASFHERCTPGDPNDEGAKRNCGWSMEHAFVGTCTAGMVDVGAGARVGNCGSPLGFSTGNTAVRACRDMNGCDEGGARFIASNDDECGDSPALRFPCPSSGVFTVMLSGTTETTPFDGEVGALGPSVFPEIMQKMFLNKEGAHYGNVFRGINPNLKLLSQGDREPPRLQLLRRGDKRHTGWKSPEIIVFEDAFACHDPGWTAQDAYQHARLCADNFPVLDPFGNPDTAKICIAQALGKCNVVQSDSILNRCITFDLDPDGDGDLDDCRDVNNVRRRWPITTFLRDPCEMLSPQDIERGLCRRNGRK
jgi:hypothetical protein